MDEADGFVHAAVRAFATGAPSPPVPGGARWIERAVQAGVLAPVVANAATAGHRLPASLDHLALSVTARHLRTLLDLGAVGAALDAAGVAWAALKGPVLRGVVFRRPDVRDYTDLDLLVSPRDLRCALGVLWGLGATLHPCDWDGARRARTAEVTLALPYGTLLDLHWNLINMGRDRAGYPIDSGTLLHRRVVRNIGGHTVSTLDDADLVLHTMLHACLSGASTLRLLLDVQQSVLWYAARHPMSTLEERARQHAVVAPARVVTVAAARHVDAGLARYWPGRRTATAWTLLVDAITRSRPPSAPSVTSRSSRRFFTATRPSSAGSMLMLSRSASGRVRRSWADQPEVVPRPTSPHDPGLEAWLQQVDTVARSAGPPAGQG